MDRLSMFLTLMTGAVLVGSLLIAILAYGLYNRKAIAELCPKVGDGVIRRRFEVA